MKATIQRVTRASVTGTEQSF